MATFTNQATLSYAGRSVASNVVTGEIVEVIGVTKTPVNDVYGADSAVTWAVTVSNSGTTPVTALTLTDNLGAYAFGEGTVVPLDYTPGAILLYSDGVLQPAPTVASTEPLTVTGLTVPALGHITLIYETTVNAFAPLEVGATITNAVTASAPALLEDVSASAVISAENGAVLAIAKALVPSTVRTNGTITYSFEITNAGNADAPGDVAVTDTFDPALSGLSVTFNGAPWTEGDQYTYDAATGEFATVAGAIPVPAATFAQDPMTGEYVITPGTAVLTVSGTV